LDDVVLSCKGISKAFPGVLALDEVEFELRRGEVHALCGENGAGKSTLVKIITGLYIKDSGEILYEGKRVDFKSVPECRKYGISLIPQELHLAERLTVAENVFMTEFPKKGNFVDWKAMFEKTRALQERIGSTALSFEPDQLVSDLNMGQKQLVEIMKAISTEVKVLAFDEPTSSLSAEEVSQLFKLIRQLTQQGISILYVTHRLNEVFSICDRVSVFKDGKYIGTEDTKNVNTGDVITMMIGREMNMFEKDPNKRIGDVRLEVKNLNRGDKVRNVSFNLKEGEILGMFGIVGSGRTETARLLFGLDKKESGNIIINKEETSIEHPIEAVSHKLGYVSEDRRGEGLAVRLNVIQNTTMPFFQRFAKRGMMKTKKEVETVENLVKEFDVKTPSLETSVENLSGGNQQKISISKWVGSESEILVLDEPTRGIDVGAKAEVYRMMEHLSSIGKSIIMISSELPEILAMSDRLLVFRDGEIVREFEDVRSLSEEDVMNYAIDANAV